MLSLTLLFVILLCSASTNAQAGSCSASTPCANANLCCSQWGFCGDSASYCAVPGCQNGPCWVSSSPAATTPPVTAAATPTPAATGAGSCSAGCAPGLCCSQWGFCGSGPAYCGSGTVTSTPSSSPTSIQTSPPTTSPTSSPTSPVTTSPVTTSPATTAPATTAPATTTPVTTTSAPVTGAPVKAIYIDSLSSWDAQGSDIKAAIDSGYNLIVLAFFLHTQGAYDVAAYWAGLDDGVRVSLVQYAHDNGAKIIVSYGGSTQRSYDQIDPTAEGQRVASWALSQHLDGVDFDLELDDGEQGFTYGSMTSSQVIQWFAAITNAARGTLGTGKLITHAPVAPYFGPTSGGPATSPAGTQGGYTAVYNLAPSIDYFLVQFYNQDSDCYETYQSLFQSSQASGQCHYFTGAPGSSVQEIASYGIPLSKIVVGKPVQDADAPNHGYVDPNTLHTWFTQAASDLHWNTGIMVWQWHNSATNSPFVHAVYP